MSRLVGKIFDEGRYWVIEYKYPNSVTWGEYAGLGSEFYVEMFAINNQISGNTIEENYFEKNANHEITGTLSGVVTAEEIRFIKTYNATNINHSIKYHGHIDFQRGQIRGVWNILGSDISNLPEGSFEMRLDEGDAFITLFMT